MILQTTIHEHSVNTTHRTTCEKKMPPLRPRATANVGLSVVWTTVIAVVVVTAVIGIFCGVVFCLVLKRQRETRKRQQALQEERAPFFAPSVQPLRNGPVPDSYAYSGNGGVMELQGDVRQQGPQLLDGYAAVVRFI